MTGNEAGKLVGEVHRLRKATAEHLYALAIWHAKHGLKEVAAGYARECLALLKTLGSETMEDCACTTNKLEDIFIPELMHEDVVKRDLARYGVTL